MKTLIYTVRLSNRLVGDINPLYTEGKDIASLIGTEVTISTHSRNGCEYKAQGIMTEVLCAGRVLNRRQLKVFR